MSIPTPFGMELIMSKDFWRRRCSDQLRYVHEIEQSDRHTDRKAELQLSALDIYRDCLVHLDKIRFFERIFDCDKRDRHIKRVQYQLPFGVAINNPWKDHPEIPPIA